MAAQRVGVVVPARSCPCGQVEAVLPQLTAGDRLVVAWNGAGAVHDCRRGVCAHPLVTWLDLGRPLGPARARNLGAAALGDAQVLAFCDADDRVAPDWVAALCRPLLDGCADLAGGAVRVVSPAGEGRIIPPGVDYWHRQAVFGGSCAITGDAWRLLGGFDESLRCCEDTDLAWRAAEADLRVVVRPSAVSEIRLGGMLRELRQRFRWGYWAVRLLRKHRVGRDHLPGLRVLLEHKATGGYAGSVLVAAAGQWAGHAFGRLVVPDR